MTLPSEVQNELQNALRKIADLLIETNVGLSRLGYEEFHTVAASLSFNDPDDECDVPRWNVVLSPAEGEFEEAEKTSIVGIYSQDGGIEYRNLVSTGIQFCDNKGMCCYPRYRCKDVSGGGDPEILVCCKVKTCPPP